MMRFYLLLVLSVFSLFLLSVVSLFSQESISKKKIEEVQSNSKKDTVQSLKQKKRRSNIAKEDINQTPEHNWHSNVEVARKAIQKVEKLKSYKADFKLIVVEGKRKKKMSGKVYYAKPNKLRYEFSQPKGNLIVSDGRIMWFYIKRINIVGKQELNLKKKQPSGRSVFRLSPLTGLQRLFKKYHYHFDTVKQPRQEEGGDFFIFSMEQREKIGGYERIKLYVDAKSYIVKMAVGDNGYGKVSTIKFSNITLDSSLDGKLFHYRPEGNVSVVLNPLVE